jgi:hypothetical protein
VRTISCSAESQAPDARFINPLIRGAEAARAGSIENVRKRQTETPKAVIKPNRTNVSSVLVAKEAKAAAVVAVVSKQAGPTSWAALRIDDLSDG